MSKRANGEGSISKRETTVNGKTVIRWQVGFPTGIRKKNGKAERLYKYAKTQAEALEILRKFQSEKAMGVNQSSTAVLTGDWMETWIEKYKAPKLAPSTLYSYKSHFRLHIKPVIGDIPLKKLTTYQIQRTLDGIGCSHSTFIKNYNIINAALKRAVDIGMMTRNPCIGINFPADDKKEMRVLTKEEQKRFIQCLDGEYYRPMFLTYLYTGMRAGEVTPLTWKDVNLKEKTISVNKKAIMIGNYETHKAVLEVQNFCKTKASTRVITITDGLVRVLTEQKAELQKRAKYFETKWSEDSLVFPNTNGNVQNSRNIQKILERVMATAGIKGVSMHTLRHTYATRCFEAGVDVKAISAQLGHASVETTYDIYIHLLKEAKVNEIDKLCKLDEMMDS